jgi:Holliday junction resolvase
MPNKKYISGVRFERKVRDYLIKKKYYVVRSAGSKGIIDLVAIPHDPVFIHRVICVQCKHNSSPLPKNSVIKRFLKNHNVRFLVALNDGSDIYFDEYRIMGNKLFIIETDIW